MPWEKTSKSLTELFQQTMKSFHFVDHRKMFGCLCCFSNGYMFTGLHEESWFLRLAPEPQAALMEMYSAHPFAPVKGRIMREYILLPKSIQFDPEELKEWIETSIVYVQSLPPKVKA